MSEAVTYRNIAELRLSSNNYRQGDVGAIVQSILTFGFNSALRVWQGDIVKAGNHSLLALQSIKASGLPIPKHIQARGNDWYAPCIDISHLSETQANAFMVADNRLTELAQNDDTRLAELLTEIASEDAKLLAATGYDGDDLDELLAGLANDALGGMEAPDAQIDKADELREKWQTERGQLWAIGKHRLLCGDSTNADDVARLMGGEKTDMVWSDPPYGLGGYAGRGGALAPVEGDDANLDDLIEFYQVGVASEVYICCEWKTYPNLLKARGEPRSLIVWAKQVFGMGRGYRRQHEFIGYYGKFDSTTESDLWQIDREFNYDHPTQKPVDLPKRAILNSSKSAGVVFDPFNGIGCCIVACEQTGRFGRGIEIDPRYVAVTLQRLADMGLTPRLLTD